MTLSSNGSVPLRTGDLLVLRRGGGVGYGRFARRVLEGFARDLADGDVTRH